jgi:hypothetical protein
MEIWSTNILRAIQGVGMIDIKFLKTHKYEITCSGDEMQSIQQAIIENTISMKDCKPEEVIKVVRSILDHFDINLE